MDGNTVFKRRMTVLLVCTFVAAALGVYASREPWKEYQLEKEITAETLDEMQKIESRRRDLMDQRARYKSNEGRKSWLVNTVIADLMKS